MVKLLKHLKYLLNVILWYKDIQLLLLVIIRNLNKSEELLKRLWKIYILFISSNNLWLKKNWKKMRNWKMKIGINIYQKFLKRLMYKLRKLLSKRRNIVLILILSNQERLICRWILVNIFWLKMKKVKNQKKFKIMKNLQKILTMIFISQRKEKTKIMKIKKNMKTLIML